MIRLSDSCARTTPYRARRHSALQFVHACRPREIRTASATLRSQHSPERSTPEVSRYHFAPTRLLELQAKRDRCPDVSHFQLRTPLALQLRDTRFALILDSKRPNLKSYPHLASPNARIGRCVSFQTSHDGASVSKVLLPLLTPSR